MWQGEKGPVDFTVKVDADVRGYVDEILRARLLVVEELIWRHYFFGCADSCFICKDEELRFEWKQGSFMPTRKWLYRGSRTDESCGAE